MERADLTGAVLDGRYRVIEPVAQGAMGVVYRAERIKLGRIVAVKVLHESLPAELSSRRRFEVEAMAMAKLEHPHCAAVVDVGLHEDRPFVVMDFVSGQDLRSVITAEAPLPIPRAIEMMRQILSGLAHAHEHGIIHRDIKPANLVLSQKAGLGDHVKILDFGLARLGQDSSLTTGIVVGTPSYMAPEQIRGQPIDGRVDVYACGVVLFELLTGDKPFVSAKDDPIEVCSLHLKQAPPRLADRRPGVEFGELEAVVARALAKSASERFASAVEFAAALDAVVPRRATPVAGVPTLEPGATLEYAGAPAQVRTATPPAGVRTLPLPVIAEPPAGPPVSEVMSASSLIGEEAAASSGAASSTIAGASGASGGGATASGAAGPGTTASGGSLVTTASGGAGLVTTASGGAGLVTTASGGAGLVTTASGAAAPAPRPSRRIALAAGGALVVIAVVVVAVTAGGGGGAVPARDAGSAAALADAPAAANPADETFARATELVAAGQKAAALDLVLAGRKLYPDDARLPYLGGKLYFEKYHWTDGMRMFRDAIRLEPSYRTDRELIRTVLRGFITTPRADAALAAFLREDIGDAARPYLEETAADHHNAAIRARAAAELRRYR